MTPDESAVPQTPPRRKLKRRSSTQNQKCNRAFMILSPFANNSKVRARLAKLFLEKDVYIVEEYHISGKRMERKGLIDAVLEGGKVAMGETAVREIDPREGNKFKNVFGESYNKAKHKILTARQAMEKYNCSASELYTAFERARLENRVVCLKANVYCGKVSLENDNTTDVYVLNGFFPALKDVYVGPPGVVLEEEKGGVHAYELEWDEDSIDWSTFRNEVIGVVPSTMMGGENTVNVNGFLQKLYDEYDEMGLETPPSVYDTAAIYMSSSPLQGLSERCTWLGRQILNDEYGAVLLRKGIPEHKILEWFNDPVLKMSGGKEFKKLSEIIKDTDASKCTQMLLKVYDSELFGVDVDGANCNCTIS